MSWKSIRNHYDNRRAKTMDSNTITHLTCATSQQNGLINSIGEYEYEYEYEYE